MKDYKQYTFWGKSIARIKNAAKLLAKKEGIRFTDALDIKAREEGCENWVHLMSLVSFEKSCYYNIIYSLKNDPIIKKEYDKFLSESKLNDCSKSYSLFANTYFNLSKLAKRGNFNSNDEELILAVSPLIFSGPRALLPKELPDKVLFMLIDSYVSLFDENIAEPRNPKELINIVILLGGNLKYLNAKKLQFQVKKYYFLLVMEDITRNTEFKILSNVDIDNIFDDNLKFTLSFEKVQ